MHAASELVPQLYRRLAREAADHEALIMAMWPVVVGGKLAARAHPVRLFGATLIIETVSQDWRRQLAHMAGEIMARLNAACGRDLIRALEFRVAVSSTPLPPRRAASASGLEKDEAAGISDPHLRRIYRQSRRRAQQK
jgi:hypothetical protein